MEPRALGNSSPTPTDKSAIRHEGRNVWILTAYGICGLALFGILAYYFSNYVTH